MQVIDWTNLHKNYKGKWVAFGKDNEKVIASGGTAKLTQDKAIKLGSKNPSIFFVPSIKGGYIG